MLLTQKHWLGMIIYKKKKKKRKVKILHNMSA